MVKKVEGYWEILGVGGVTSVDGSTVGATEDNISEHFPEARQRPESENDWSDSSWPDLGASRQTPIFKDDGFAAKTPNPADDPAFVEASKFAEENGLTAVLAVPRQDVDSEGYEIGASTMRYDSPRIIYLDANGNQVDPEGAPEMNNPIASFLPDEKLGPDDAWGGIGSGPLLEEDPSIVAKINEALNEIGDDITSGDVRQRCPCVLGEWSNNAFEHASGLAVPYTPPSDILEALKGEVSEVIADLSHEMKLEL